jgi:hypothetical protein
VDAGERGGGRASRSRWRSRGGPGLRREARTSDDAEEERRGSQGRRRHGDGRRRDLYGIDEDDHCRPAVLTPIELAGAAERVALIVSTSIAEVPHIETRALPCADDPSKGYLLVIVPPSSRAPHQVTVGKDLRFYGRYDKTNRILGEADVARLYERRGRWQRDRHKTLTTVIDNSPHAPREKPAFVYAFVEPVVPDQALWERAERAVGDRQ